MRVYVCICVYVCMCSAQLHLRCQVHDAGGWFSVGKEIKLQTNTSNPYLKTYHDNWLEMRHKYMKSVGSLIDVMENKILFVNAKTQKMELRNISSRELADLETQTRVLLGELYSNAHQHYVLGVNALHDYYHNLTAGVNVY